MKKSTYLFVVALFSIASFAQTTWNVDPMHSFLNFSVKHMGISFVDGKFDKYEGVYNGTSDDLTKGVFKFSIDAKSINTGIEMRDQHLTSPDFFDVEKYGQLNFESTKITKVKGSENQYKLVGFITIKDIKKPITFDLTYGGHLADDGNGLQRMGIQAKATLNRFDFGIAYDPSATAIAKDITLNINLEFTAK
ncbi:YceI family protein [Myroides guanonis]|uniref:Polyisoprenoid-binding protein YceI n=1 Tax=Myroides guanonis TaxID=1150112 RepID=A0A1I3SM26_9FLAO|nr:YceI family protein [Myroides guanonis]SFJ58447.1 Polyisoprenoid-binding protein YceI [Myroides guanonis]